MKKISIITVCWNAKEDLRRTLESVEQQIYPDLEYIVMDGGSTDGTVELLDAYALRFASAEISFRYISEPDKGTYDAMNKGALLAQGEWINYMNAGDAFYSPSCLMEFFTKGVEEDAGVIYGDTFQMFDFGSGIATEADYLKDNTVMPFCHQSCFVRRELMTEFKFDLSYRIIADHDLFYRLRKSAVRFQYIPVVIARYNGQYGLSATHPLTLHLEGLRSHQITERWYYPFALFWTYLRYGWVQPFKNHMPRRITDWWMKRKRKRFINKTPYSIEEVITCRQ